MIDYISYFWLFQLSFSSFWNLLLQKELWIRDINWYLLKKEVTTMHINFYQVKSSWGPLNQYKNLLTMQHVIVRRWTATLCVKCWMIAIFLPNRNELFSRKLRQYWIVDSATTVSNLCSLFSLACTNWRLHTSVSRPQWRNVGFGY